MHALEDFLDGEWNLRPFVGYYVNKDGRAASMDGVHLINHIVDNLYVGGHGFIDLEDNFSHVFSLYPWGEPYAGTGERRSLALYDAVDQDPTDALVFASEVVEALNKGGNVLVHCQAGINRSNLVAALALREWKGLTSREAIDMLREKRSPLVLANPTFEKFLLDLDKE